MSTWKYVTRELRDVIREQYRLAWHGIHGIGHWNRVRENGLRLAKSTGADVMVVELFAALHDSRRFNDNYDPPGVGPTNDRLWLLAGWTSGELRIDNFRGDALAGA